MDGQDVKVSGWKEWLALPEIGIPGIEASIDTSSEVSTLQASFVEHYRRDGELWVRFGVNPLSQR
ncbi:MAG: ATP-dependent zinc protease, partial [Nitrospinaceae bacterium]|nr:ATP-dependent zinc protease [Nitrospinaceae bacterium]